MTNKTQNSASADIKTALTELEDKKEFWAKNMQALLAVPDLRAISDDLYEMLGFIQQQINKIGKEKYYTEKEPLLQNIAAVIAEQRKKIAEIQAAVVDRNLIQINKKIEELLTLITDCRTLINTI